MVGAELRPRHGVAAVVEPGLAVGERWFLVAFDVGAVAKVGKTFGQREKVKMDAFCDVVVGTLWVGCCCVRWSGSHERNDFGAIGEWGDRGSAANVVVFADPIEENQPSKYRVPF